MYRDNYQQNSMPSSLNQQGYEYRPGHGYKPNPSMQPMMPPLPPPHQMYYDTQQPLDQGYMSGMSGMGGMGGMPNVGMMMPMQPMDGGYDHQRYYWRQMEQKHNEGYGPLVQPPQYAPQPMNLIQRISGVIKSQLPMLQAIMATVSSSSYAPARIQSSSSGRRQHSRQRSRSKDRRRKNSDSAHDWLCRKCSFSNYDWRDSCKKCSEARPSRSFVPGPEDWKCPKCSNINYARRAECNRCKRPKNGE